MDFEIIGEITHLESIAVEQSIHDLARSPYFAVCLNNAGYPASLEVGKPYRVIPDEDAAVHGYLRVIDESGEDYGYATERFYPVVLPQVVEQTLLFASEKLAV